MSWCYPEATRHSEAQCSSNCLVAFSGHASPATYPKSGRYHLWVTTCRLRTAAGVDCSCSSCLVAVAVQCCPPRSSLGGSCPGSGKELHISFSTTNHKTPKLLFPSQSLLCIRIYLSPSPNLNFLCPLKRSIILPFGLGS